MSNNFIILYIKEFLNFVYFNSNFKFHYISTIYYWKLNFFLKCVTSFRGVREMWDVIYRGGGVREMCDVI